MIYEIKNHRLYADGNQVPYSLTPNRSGKYASVPDGIILHDTAGRLDGTSSVDWFMNPDARASAHLVLFRDGSVHQMAPFDTIAWHAGKSSFNGRDGVNRFALGIEIVNPGKLTPLGGGAYKSWFKETYSTDDYDILEQSTPEHGSGGWMDYTDAQIDAVVGICTALKEKYGLSWIWTHWKVSPGRKVDTNPLFPLERVQSKVFGRSDDDVGSQGRVLANANHRRWPSYADNIIDEIPRDTVVEIIRSGWFVHEGESELWHLVGHAGHNGWVHGSLIEPIV